MITSDTSFRKSPSITLVTPFFCSNTIYSREEISLDLVTAYTLNILPIPWASTIIYHYNLIGDQKQRPYHTFKSLHNRVQAPLYKGRTNKEGNSSITLTLGRSTSFLKK